MAKSSILGRFSWISGFIGADVLLNRYCVLRGEKDGERKRRGSVYKAV